MASDNVFKQLGDQIGKLITDPSAREDINKSINVFAQGAVARLDLVTRDEFDANLEALHQSQQRIAELESQIEELRALLDELEQKAAG